ncbi:MAG: methionine adenosyltransferase domain-containing protein, partial [Acidobacteria bacterium]|nr:methionine adenosyltransferase domain-containing protein [Acidobacteriota bacterium]
SSWVKQKFPDLSPRHIIDYLGLFGREGWRYAQTAAYGHYGREEFPWEKIANV